jgi:uncharacterized DUF497 family protein
MLSELTVWIPACGRVILGAVRLEWEPPPVSPISARRIHRKEVANYEKDYPDV